MTWLQVDGVTMEMLKTLNMATLPGVILQAVSIKARPDCCSYVFLFGIQKGTLRSPLLMLVGC